MERRFQERMHDCHRTAVLSQAAVKALLPLFVSAISIGEIDPDYGKRAEHLYRLPA